MTMDTIVQRVSDISSFVGVSFGSIQMIENIYSWECGIKYISKTDTILVSVSDMNVNLFYTLIGYCSHNEINFEAED